VTLIFLMFAAFIKVAMDICSYIGGDWLLSLPPPSMATELAFEFDNERSEPTN